MNCDDTRRLLDADVDGELDLARHLEMAAHLQSCRDCAQAAEASRARAAALREHLTRFPASPALADRIRQSLPARSARNPAPAWNFWRLAGGAAALAACVAIGFGWGTGRARSVRMADEAVADHVRSLMVSHLTDVASTDQHTVKPWFAGKLEFSPPVVDLAIAGYPLIGGRLDEIAGQPAAALVYRRRQHVINLLIWPAAAGSVGAGRHRRDGYEAESWTQDGLNFVAVSEIPAAELADFVALYRARVP